jgi:hypothetical protein
MCFLIIFLISSCSSLEKYFYDYNINFKVDTNLINDKNDNKTKSHIPLLTWRHKGPYTVLLDPNEGLFAY